MMGKAGLPYYIVLNTGTNMNLMGLIHGRGEQNVRQRHVYF